MKSFPIRVLPREECAGNQWRWKGEGRGEALRKERKQRQTWISPVNILPYSFKYNGVMFTWNSNYGFQRQFSHLKAKEWIQLLALFMDQGRNH